MDYGTMSECKKKKKMMKTPLVATRASQRVPKHGVFVMQRGETIASQCNDLSGNANPFDILKSVSRDKLMEVASHSHVVLGENTNDINNQIYIMLAKEKAEVVLAENRDMIRKERRNAKVSRV
jgi:hypothetical protein